MLKPKVIIIFSFLLSEFNVELIQETLAILIRQRWQKLICCLHEIICLPICQFCSHPSNSSKNSMTRLNKGEIYLYKYMERFFFSSKRHRKKILSKLGEVGREYI